MPDGMTVSWTANQFGHNLYGQGQYEEQVHADVCPYHMVRVLIFKES